MGYYTHIHVCFESTFSEPVAAIARRHLPEVGESRIIEAKWFLESLAERTGTNPGPKGGLCLWGMVANGVPPEDFVAVLGPFWEDILQEPDDDELSDISPHNHIVVFYEGEDSLRCECWEIFRDFEKHPMNDPNLPPLTVKHHERLPFIFNQM